MFRPVLLSSLVFSLACAEAGTRPADVESAAARPTAATRPSAPTTGPKQTSTGPKRTDEAAPTEAAQPAESPRPQHPLVKAARAQVGVTLTYDPAYVGLDYPNGDVAIERGVCTDVVIRAMREAHAFDLQRKVHEDMRGAFAKYPTIWRARRPDRNIDHRRVPNLRRFFERRGWSVGVTRNPADYLPGDIVTCTVAGNRPHIMIVSDRKTAGGVPLVIHNIGAGTQEEDSLFTYPLTGHFRPKLDANPSGRR